MTTETWLASLPQRHAAAMTRSEFLKAIRALSARYVERRGSLPDRSPIDSAGKRVAFAAFYAPLHFLTAQLVLRELGSPTGVSTIFDAGCGTGVAGAAWALAVAGSKDPALHRTFDPALHRTFDPALHQARDPARHQTSPSITGVDLNGWVLDEARETWRALELSGRAVRGDFVNALAQLNDKTKRAQRLDATGIVLGWSLNELDSATCQRARTVLDALAARGARILVLEPIAKSLVSWWDDWSASASRYGALASEWRFADALPSHLAQLSDEAGFARTELTARSMTFNFELKT